MKKRRRFTEEFKSKVALEALREKETIHALAQRYQLQPAQVSEWKKALLAGAGKVFSSDRKDQERAQKQKRKEDRLYKQIGHLQVQVDFLKEACDGLGIGVPQDELDRL